MPRNLDLYRNRAQVQNNPTNTLGASTAAAIAAQKPPDLLQLVVDALESLVNEILQGIDDLTGLDLVGFAKTLESLFGSGNLLGEFVNVIMGVVGQIAALIEGVGGTVIGDVVTAIKDVVSFVENLPAEIAAILSQIPIIATILKLLGLGGSSGTGGGTTTTPTPPPDLTLQQFLGLLDTTTSISPSQLQALASSSSKNLLTDPGFNSGSVIDGNGQWCWDGWIGTGASSGINSSIRTVRPGVITIYNIVGTSQGVYMFGNEPIGVGGSGIILEYLRTNLLGYLGTSIDWPLTSLDQTYFEWINVPYPAASYPMGPSVTAGFQWLVNSINQIPGPFFFVMDSQGNQVGAAVYDEIRYGSLQSRNNDFLGALAMGNLRREEGHYFPGCPDLAPGTAGMCCVSLMTTGPYTGSANPANPKIGNLVDTEDRWYDFAVPGDYFACTPIAGNTVDPGPSAIGGNVGDMAGISGTLLRTFYKFVNFNNSNASVIANWLQWASANGLAGGVSIISDFLGAPMAQINNLGNPNSPHQSYYKDTRPLVSLGDTRTYLEIGLDYLQSFVGGYHPDGTKITPPPVVGTRHQYACQRFAVQPYQVVTAGASAMWINVDCPGDAIIVCVNAYDSSGNLIATVTASECIISGPASSSNWVFNPLKADFVMPAGAATACLVLDVEPEAMTTGIVWFDDLIFEVDSLIDGAMINSPTLTGIPGEAVAGPQGQADILTAWQNQIDQLASAHSQTPITGVTLANMLEAVGQTALNASLSYELGVAHQQILGNVSTQPYWSGMQPSGQVTIPLPTGSTPTATVPAGGSILGFINTTQAIMVGFVEFQAKYTGTPTAVYVNAYTMDPTTGNMTNVYASADISSELSTSAQSWVPITISTGQPSFALSQGVWWEIANNGSGTLAVTAPAQGASAKSYAIPPAGGATRTLSSTGGVSPTSLTPSQLSYGTTVPFICMSVTNLPPMYQPPNFTPFTSGAGIYNYPIPSWAQVSGATFSMVANGGGGAGGHATGTINPGIFGIGASSTLKYGQGGLPGEWSTQNLTYGTDIPSGTTALTVITGAGGCAPSGNGANTIIGTGFTTAPTFDAVGIGGAAHATTLSWSHTATAGAYVVVAINTGLGTFNLTYGTATMIPLGLVYNNNSGTYGATALYGLPNAPAGASTVTVTLAKTAYVTGNSISFTNCSSAGPVTNVHGKGTALSQVVMCGTNQTIVQALGTYRAAMSGFAGGTKRYSGSYPAVKSGSNTFYYQGLSLSYATTATTFTAVDSIADEWGGIAVALQPSGTVLLSATGGQAGGSPGAANYNPNNANTTPTGKGALNQFWAGRNYPGSSDTTATAFPGNPWGGGSASGNLSSPPLNGADGAAWIVANQPGTIPGGGFGGGIGGGSELTVTYEATGGGGENTTGSPLTWTHTSSGGPNAGVVLLGAVAYSSGTATPTATYGSLTFNQNLGGVTFYNSGGFALYLFALGIIGIPSGTQTITLSAGGATINDLAGSTLSYTNVGSFGNFYQNHGHGTAMSLPGIPSSSGQMTVAGFASLTHSLGSDFNHTSRWSENVTSSIPMVIGDATGGSTVNFTASVLATDYWGGVGGVLLPPS